MTMMEGARYEALLKIQWLPSAIQGAVMKVLARIIHDGMSLGR